MVLGLGADSSFRRPMAVAVIGGLLTSTALSLLVVPVVFSSLDGFERRLRRWLRRGPQDLPSPSERPSARQPPPSPANTCFPTCVLKGLTYAPHHSSLSSTPFFP